MSTIFGLHEATNRKTKCYWLNIFGVRVLISYETPVAFNDYRTGHFRRSNDWGPTTGRHLRETGCDEWKVIEDEGEFNRKLDAAIMANVLRDQDTLKKAIAEVVARKLVPELA